MIGPGRVIKRILTFALSLTMLYVTLVRAAEGRIPIFQPTTITAPGHYVVTRDIAAAGSSVITIGASGSSPFKSLTLDLNGHALITDGNFPAIAINGAFISKGLTIRNGRLIGPGTGFGSGILASGGGAFQIRIEDLEISYFGNDGLTVDSASYMEVVGCHIHDIGRMGIYGNTMGAAPFTGKFLHNTLERIQETGIYLLDLQGGQINGNVVTNFGLLTTRGHVGIWLGTVAGGVSTGGGGNQIEGNSISSLAAGNGNAGVYMDGGIPQNRIAYNVLHGNGGGGIVVGSSRNRVLGNVSSDNDGDGIRVFPGPSRNHFEGNQVQGNIGTDVCGIKLQFGPNSFRDNVGGGNTASGSTCIAAGNIDLGGNSGL